MKRVFKLLTLGAAALAIVWIFPTVTHAGCATAGPIAMGSSAGMDILGTATNSYFSDPTKGIGGSFWLQGAGNPAVGVGSDSGAFGNPVVDPTTFGAGDWLSDFLVGDGTIADRFFVLDLSFPYDGCLGANTTAPAEPTDITFAVVTDTNNNYVVFSAAGSGNATLDWDFILISGGGAGTAGGMVPDAIGSVGMPLQRAVNVASSSVAGSTATVIVNPLVLNYFDDTGSNSRAGDLQVDLYGYQGGVWTALGTGTAGGEVAVDVDSTLCWGFSTGEFVPSDISTGNGHLGVACIPVGGSTPSQHVDKAVATKANGFINFDWHVTAQLDIVGFDVVSIDPTKGTERKLNNSPIFQGTNNAEAQSYSIDMPRSVVKRPGVFELRMTRQDGSVTSTTFINE